MQLNRNLWLVTIALIAVLASAFGPAYGLSQVGRRDRARRDPWSARRWANQIAFSPDLKTVAFAKSDLWLVELWDAQTGILKRALTGHGGPITSLAFSPDSRTLVTGCREPFDPKPDETPNKKSTGVIKVWDIQTGELKLSLKAHEDMVSALAVAPDGKTLISGGHSSFVSLLMADDSIFSGASSSGPPLGGRGGGLRSSRMSQGELKVWDIEKRKEMRSLKWSSERVGPMVLSPDGTRLAVGKTGFSNEIKLVDVRSGKTQHTLKVKGKGSSRGIIDALVFSPDSLTLATGTSVVGLTNVSRQMSRLEIQSCRVDLWDAQTGRRKSSLDAYKAPVRSLAFTQDGSALLDWTGEDSINITDIRDGVVRRVENPAWRAQVVTFSPDGRKIAAATDNKVTLADTRTGEINQTLMSDSEAVRPAPADSFVVSVKGVLTIAFSPDGRTVANAGNDKTIELWDAVAAVEKQKLTGHTGTVLSVAISPDGATLASGGSDRQVKLWDAKAGAVKRTLAENDAAVNCVAFSPDGATIAGASDDGSIILWNTLTGEIQLEIDDLNAPVKAIAFSPDGSTLAGAVDATLILWDTNTGGIRRVFRGHTASIMSVAFSPDGTTLASGGTDAAVRLWNVQTGALKRALAKHDAAVNSVAFAPGGKTLASGSDDRKINIWDVETGKLERSLKGHEIAVYSVAFSPDGRLLASGGGNNGLIFWDAQTGELKQTLRRLNVPLRSK